MKKKKIMMNKIMKLMNNKNKHKIQLINNNKTKVMKIIKTKVKIKINKNNKRVIKYVEKDNHLMIINNV